MFHHFPIILFCINYQYLGVAGFKTIAASKSGYNMLQIVLATTRIWYKYITTSLKMTASINQEASNHEDNSNSSIIFLNRWTNNLLRIPCANMVSNSMPNYYFF